MIIPDYTVSLFKGLNTFVKDTRKLKAGFSIAQLNWLTGKYGDHIELARGRARLGQTEVTGFGKITGLGVVRRFDGLEIPFFSYESKVKYYDETTDDVIEVGSQLLGSDADGEDVWFSPYQNLGGSFMYCGCRESSIFKIPAANPGSAVDLGVTSYRFHTLRFGNGRSLAGQRNGSTAGNKDLTGLYESKIDNALLTSFTNAATTTTNTSLGNTNGILVTFGTTLPLSSQSVKSSSLTVDSGGSSETFSETGTGVLTGSLGGTGTINYDTGVISVTFAGAPTGGSSVTAHYKLHTLVGALGSTSYSGTLPLSGATCMYVSFIERGGETLRDDRNGNLVGSSGSTGTINYATGAYDLTFNHATTGTVNAEFYTESSTSTILNFDTSTTGAGYPKTYRQDNGGIFQAIFNFLGVSYAFHEFLTWAVSNPLDDQDTTNLPYRAVGIPYHRAACETPEGILFLDTSKPSDPKVRRLEIMKNTNELTIEPVSLSDSLDLSGYVYDYATAFRFGDYDIMCLAESVSGTPNTYNSRMFLRNHFSGAWDLLGYRASVLTEYQGTLLIGDSLSNNLYTLLSGFDDDEGPVENYWQGSPMNLGTGNTKRAHKMQITGLIQSDQRMKVSIVPDNGDPIEVFTVRGNGDYVDAGIDTPIGSDTIGSRSVGGGGEATAHPYDVTFDIHTDKFKYISVRVEALAIGYVSVHSYTFVDIRDKGPRALPIKTA